MTVDPMDVLLKINIELSNGSVFCVTTLRIG